MSDTFDFLLQVDITRDLPLWQLPRSSHKKCSRARKTAFFNTPTRPELPVRTSRRRRRVFASSTIARVWITDTGGVPDAFTRKAALPATLLRTRAVDGGRRGFCQSELAQTALDRIKSKFLLHSSPEPGLSRFSRTKNHYFPTGTLSQGLPHTTESIIRIIRRHNRYNCARSDSGCNAFIKVGDVLNVRRGDFR